MPATSTARATTSRAAMTNGASLLKPANASLGGDDAEQEEEHRGAEHRHRGWHRLADHEDDEDEDDAQGDPGLRLHLRGRHRGLECSTLRLRGPRGTPTFHQRIPVDDHARPTREQPRRGCRCVPVGASHHRHLPRESGCRHDRRRSRRAAHRFAPGCRSRDRQRRPTRTDVRLPAGHRRGAPPSHPGARPRRRVRRRHARACRSHRGRGGRLAGPGPRAERGPPRQQRLLR